MAGVSANRTRRHWAICATIRAMETDCLYEEWVDRLLMDMETLDDEEAAWRAACSPDDCIDWVEKARKLVDVSTPPKQLALASSSSSNVVILPTQPMGGEPHASGGGAALVYSSEQGDHPPITFLLSPLAPGIQSDAVMAELL